MLRLAWWELQPSEPFGAASFVVASLLAALRLAAVGSRSSAVVVEQAFLARFVGELLGASVEPGSSSSAADTAVRSLVAVGWEASAVSRTVCSLRLDSSIRWAF